MLPFLCVLVVFSDVLTAYSGWDYITLHCRNNANEPVSWWHIYKPPATMNPYMTTGRNFTYLTPEDKGQWQLSNTLISSNSMMQFTLDPMYRKTYSEHLAVIAYHQYNVTKNSKKGVPATSALGVVMSDELGGFWLGHTIPGLLDDSHKPQVPEEEFAVGHSLMCLSMDIKTINSFVRTLKLAIPTFKYYKLPERMKNILPDWVVPTGKLDKSRSLPYDLEFVTSKNYKVALYAKLPDTPVNLYRRFARRKKIILDVYGSSNSDSITTICGQNYGVRNIDTISLKLPKSYADITGKDIIYIGNLPDRSRFAVSTAAKWQRTGTGPTQYWTCFGNTDKEDKTGQPGILVCIEDYDMWWAFDTLKVKEPEC